jgi:hypothetical protein
MHIDDFFSSSALRPHSESELRGKWIFLSSARARAAISERPQGRECS